MHRWINTSFTVTNCCFGNLYVLNDMGTVSIESVCCLMEGGICSFLFFSSFFHFFALILKVLSSMIEMFCIQIAEFSWLPWQYLGFLESNTKETYFLAQLKLEITVYYCSISQGKLCYDDLKFFCEFQKWI